MPWGAEQTQADVTEAAAGLGADGPWVTLRPNEACHYTVVRKDAAAAGDRWLVDVISSVNAGRVDDPPFERFVIIATAKTKSIIIASVYAFRIHIQNAEISATDVVATDHFWKVNGVSL